MSIHILIHNELYVWRKVIIIIIIIVIISRYDDCPLIAW